jgi:hypothetical protein
METTLQALGKYLRGEKQYKIKYFTNIYSSAEGAGCEFHFGRRSASHNHSPYNNEMEAIKKVVKQNNRIQEGY